MGSNKVRDSSFRDRDMEKNDYIKYLNNWYNKLRSRYVDLIGDFGGSELFVVEGDSLLYEFLCDPEKHFLNFIQPYGGGQFLSLTYLVETFLNKLKQRGCVFHLVFFNAHKVIWDCNPKFRIAREIIIDHLKSCQHKSKVSIYEFPAWWDPQFDQYIDDRQPLFILSGDGSAEDDIEDSKILSKESLRKMSILLKGLFYHSLHKDLSMALIPGMEFRDSRAQAFVFDRGGNVELSTVENIQNIVDLCSIEATNSNEHENQAVFSNRFNDQENQNALLNLLLNEQENQNVLNNGGRRLILAIISLITLLNQNSEPIYRLLSKLFLLHIYLLDYITLQLRTLPSMKEIDINNDNIINKFLESFYYCCDKVLVNDSLRKIISDFENAKNNLADFVDIRLFISLVQLQKDGDLDFNSLPNEIRQDFDIAWNILKHYDNNNIINFNGLLNNIQIEEHNIPTYANNELSLLPFNYPFFVEILGDMQLEFGENNTDIIDYGSYGMAENIPYDEITHWHSTKPLKEPTYNSKFKNKTKIEIKQRNYQKYVRFLDRYASSLYGTQGFYRSKIIVDKNGDRKSNKKLQSKPFKNMKKIEQANENSVIIDNENGAKNGDKKSNKKQNKQSNSKKIIEKAENERLEKSLNKDENSFNVLIEEINKISNIESKLSHLCTQIDKDKFEHPVIKMRAQIYKLQFLLDQWIEYCINANSKKRDSNHYEIPVKIYRQIFLIAQNFNKIIDKDQKDYLVEILERLGLEDSKIRFLTMVDIDASERDNNEKDNKKDKQKEKQKEKKKEKQKDKQKLKFEMPKSSTNLMLDISDARFQMLFAGHLMDRNTNSVDDKRVKNFKPDQWQSEVLNVIDNNESALVCCPTSSGKTFISFYAMEKVLREDDEGILVYVSPTKALVNQVTAEVYGRFEKNYEKGGKTVWGIWTREYKENNEKCQILVTVPEMLEILLLSPTSVKWVSRIRRIILDEVHCIGEMDGGSTWESLLLLAQCPILALSATIGNPKPFSKWIEKIQTFRGNKMNLIKTTKRFSDLQQYVFIPKFPLHPLVETTVKPNEELRQDCLISIHPFSAMSSVVVAESGIPADMKLLPSHCIELWDAMNYVNKDDPELQNINPDKYFKDNGYIVKDDADKFEADIKKLIISWAKDKSKTKMFKTVIENLGNDIKERFNELESTAKINNEQLDVYDENFYKIAIVPLLCELSAQDKLPAILFHFDRNGCTQLAIDILEELEAAENQKRRNDPEFEAKKKDAIAQKEKYEKQSKQKRDTKKRKDDDGDDELDPPLPNIFDWEAHDPNFTFVNPKYQIPSDELQELINTFKDKIAGSLSKLIDALKRGIGVHHAGLPRKYLGAVEILFRKRHLSVVIATGTLALGINMPCRTTVFVGDSVFLTPLQYRQMSGRSGRRGYDLIGNVAFFGITLTKIKRLLTSELPDINGHFPLTTSLVLRMFILLNNSEDKDYSEKAVSGLFGDSFFCLGKEHLSGQIKHHLRFSIEYLRRENILDQEGTPINLSGMISHLYYTEPSNFAMAALFKHGVFHEICSEVEVTSNPTKMMESLVLILSHLFNRKKLRHVDQKFYREILEKYPSKLFLPKLPEKTREILEEHNERILKIYTDYVIAFTRQNMENLGPDNCLPLSKFEFPPKQLDDNIQEWNLIEKLNSMAIPFSARSPFIAMCGSIGDEFINIEDLCEHIHHKIYLDLHSIPYIKIGENLNAYLLDFFSHGQETALNKANGIRPGEVWQCLKDFDFILQTIITSLTVRKIESEENVLKGFKMVSESFREKFVKIWA